MTRADSVAALVRIIDAALELVSPQDRNVVLEESVAKVRTRRARSISSLGTRVDPRRERE